LTVFSFSAIFARNAEQTEKNYVRRVFLKNHSRPHVVERKTGDRPMKRLLICFAAGCLGGLADSLVVWLFGDLGITRTLGVSIAPALTAGWLYPRIVWGGIWGLLFILPFSNSKPISKGTILSLVPTIVQLFIVFPYKAKKGIAGIELGILTPAFVFVFNWVWGVVTALTIKYSK
jgi:hypothetical protein